MLLKKKSRIFARMNTTLLIHSKHTLDFGDFQDYLEIPNLVLDFISEMPESIHWYFIGKEHRPHSLPLHPICKAATK